MYPLNKSRTDLSRSQRKHRNRKKRFFRNPFATFFHDKWIIWGSISSICMVVGGLIWFFGFYHHATIEGPISKIEKKKTTVAPNPVRPDVHLLKSSETDKDGDLFEVSHTEKIILRVTTQVASDEPIAIRVREGGTTGKKVIEKNLLPHKQETFTHEKALSLWVSNPALVTIWVNGVIIESAQQQNSQLYQFQIAKKKDKIQTNT